MNLRITVKTKKLRLMFVSSLVLIFCCLYYIMNLSFNQFNRNPSINSMNIELIEKHLTYEEQSFLISEVVDVNLFIEYITFENFNLFNFEKYNLIRELSHTDSLELIVNSYETLGLTIEDFEILLRAYSLEQIYTMKTVGSIYNPKAKIVFEPQKDDALVNNDFFIYSYSSNNLVEIPAELTLNNSTIYIEDHILPHLLEFCEAAENEFNEPNCGGMEIFSGYRSYEEQLLLYNFYLESGIENMNQLIHYPGHSEKQLGKSIYIADSFYGTDFPLTEKADFIRNNSYKYGFIIRYPEGKEKITGIIGDASTLRFVGVDLAKKLHEQGLTLEEYHMQQKNVKSNSETESLTDQAQ